MQYLGIILSLLGGLSGGGGGKSEKPSLQPPTLPMSGGGAGVITANRASATPSMQNPQNAWNLFGGFA